MNLIFLYESWISVNKWLLKVKFGRRSNGRTKKTEQKKIEEKKHQNRHTDCETRTKTKKNSDSNYHHRWTKNSRCVCASSLPRAEKKIKTSIKSVPFALCVCFFGVHHHHYFRSLFDVFGVKNSVLFFVCVSSCMCNETKPNAKGASTINENYKRIATTSNINNSLRAASLIRDEKKCELRKKNTDSVLFSGFEIQLDGVAKRKEKKLNFESKKIAKRNYKNAHKITTKKSVFLEKKVRTFMPKKTKNVHEKKKQQNKNHISPTNK